jgi:hypothetical protein
MTCCSWAGDGISHGSPHIRIKKIMVGAAYA